MRAAREVSLKLAGSASLIFFGSAVSPESPVAAAEYNWDIVDIGGEAESDGWGGGRCEHYVETTRFVTVCAICIRRLGWVSRSKARDEISGSALLPLTLHGKSARCGHTKEIAEFVRENNIYAEERDGILGEAAISWARDLSSTTPDQYIYTIWG